MQPPPLDPASSANPGRHYSVTLATIAAVCAILAVPFGFVPFAGLAASMLVLGFIGVLAIWTRRKRAFIGMGIAFLAAFIGAISSLVCLGAIIQSRDAANARVAQVQTQLQAMRAQANSSSDRKVWGDLIKVLGGNDVTDDQAKFWGGLVDLHPCVAGQQQVRLGQRIRLPPQP